VSNIDPRPEIRSLEKAVDSMHRDLAVQIDGVGSEVGQVRGDLAMTKDELTALRREFEEYAQTAARQANVQESTTVVGNLRAELERQFGHYAVVRRTSTGMLQAFDVGNVTNQVVSQVSEELMIQTPRYWLAPAIVALAAWSRDDEEVAEKSVREAFSRDKNKTSLFFALILRRQGRLDEALRWLRHYLTSLDPLALGREFSIILEATSYDAFGPAGQALLSEVMTRWCAELRTRSEIVEDQIQTWIRELGTNREMINGNEYTTIATYAPDWSTFAAQLEQASALPVIIDKYEAIKSFDAPIPSSLEDILDDILDTLTEEFDEEELPLRREVLYHEAVIETRGDLDLARDRGDHLQKALEERIDVVSMQTRAAMTPELLGVGTQTQRIAIGVGQDDFRTGVGRFCAAYRGQAVDNLKLTFSPTHSNYATTYGFPGLTVQTNDDEQDVVSRISAAWKKSFDAHIAKISFKNSWYYKPAAIAGVVALISFFINVWLGVLVLLAGAGIVYYQGEEARQKCAADIAAAKAAQASAVEHTTGIFRDCVAQFIDARLLYGDLDAQEAELLRLIDTWPTANSTPLEGAS
jgi:tetratricopeptide (TPR) repeat protein